MAGSKILHGKITSRGPAKPETRPVHYVVTIIGTVEAVSLAEGKSMVYKDTMDVAGNIIGATDAFVSLRRKGAGKVVRTEKSLRSKYVRTATRNTGARATRGLKTVYESGPKPKKRRGGTKPRKYATMAESNAAKAAAAKQMNNVMSKWDWADMHDVDRRFHNNISNLSKQERVIVAHRFGLNGVKEMKPATVQQMFNISQYEYSHALGTGLLKLGLKGYKRGIKVIPATYSNENGASV